MGLFSNKDKPCPICGAATPRLLATKIIDEIPVCSHCAKKISMVDTQVWELSVEGLKEHLAMREENANYFENIFQPNEEISIGWTNLNIDEANQVFTIPLNTCGDIKNPPVFKFEELIGYELVDDHGLIEGCNRGDAAPQLTPAAYFPVILPGDRTRRPKSTQYNISRDFNLYLYLSNPCWDKVEAHADSILARESEFHEEYNALLGQLRMVTATLAAIMGVDAMGAAVEGNADNMLKIS